MDFVNNDYDSDILDRCDTSVTKTVQLAIVFATARVRQQRNICFERGRAPRQHDLHKAPLGLRP